MRKRILRPDIHSPCCKSGKGRQQIFKALSHVAIIKCRNFISSNKNWYTSQWSIGTHYIPEHAQQFLNTKIKFPRTEFHLRYRVTQKQERKWNCKALYY